MLCLKKVNKSHPLLVENMKVHYSQPKGFVGRCIPYLIYYDDLFYGSIVGGSSTLHLPGRDEYFNIDKSCLNNIINNIFFHVDKVNGKYPIRNFTTRIIKEFREKISNDWYDKYGDRVIGFETLVEIPRTGEIYIRDKWDYVGQTKGYTCKRVGGISTDSWSGRRVWDYNNLRPKLVFCKHNV